MTVQVFVRDAALRRVGQVEDFTLEMPIRFNRVSTWQLTADASSQLASLLEDTGGIVVVRDGVTLLSGPVTTRTFTRTEGRTQLVASGVDDTVWLARRLALPVPSGPPYTAQAYDDRSGVAETVMRGYVNDNLGPGATAARKLTALTLAADGGRGTSVRGRARFVSLLELLQSLALAGGDLGFRIVQVGLGLEFQIYEPADRTGTAVFSSELGNLAGYTFSRTVPVADYAYVGGGGEGTARTIVEGGDTAAIGAYGRSEVFVDRRDTTLAADLEQSRDEALVEQGATSSLSLTPINTESVAYGQEYTVGDRVSVVVEGVTVQEVVREVVLRLDANGEVLTPVVGTAGASSPQVPALFDAQARQARRLSNIERR